MNAWKVDKTRTRRSAFTLIELLVVVAIIALLISILLPSLSRAREQTRQTICMANLRSVGQAFTMYAMDEGGVWPPAVDTLATQNRWPVPFFDAGIVHQKLDRYDDTGKLLEAGGPSIFLCPSERASRAIENWRDIPGHTVDRVEIGGSYSYSEEVHRQDKTGIINRGDIDTPPYLRPIDKCPRPSAVFMLIDNYKPITSVTDYGWRYTRDDFYQGYRYASGEPDTDPRHERFRRIGDRHNGGLNVLAIDSHAERSQFARLTYNDISWTRWDEWPTLPPGGQ